MQIKKKPRRRYSFYIYIICFVFLYALFAPSRIKGLLSFKIEGITTTNELWLIPLFCLLIYIIKGNRVFYASNKYSLFLFICILAYIFIIILGGFYVVSIPQYIYAGLLFIIPILNFFPMSQCRHEEINLFIKFFIVVSMIYAVFAIILTTNYAYFMDLVGNFIDYRYYYQYRPSMMLGSSITVSYYFNLTLPLCFYMFYSSDEKKWRVISVLAIVADILASLVLLSRAAIFCTIIIIIFYLLFAESDRNKYGKKVAVIILFMFAIIYAFKKYSLSRILTGYDLSGNSVFLRLKSASLGLNIFTQYPIFGSGMGRFFERAYTYRYITVDGVTGLIDPHNMYVLIMSEMGIIGLIITVALFVILFKSFSYIKEKSLRQTAYITLIAFLFSTMGGSHLFNSISFAIIFWIYMGLFNAISINNRNELRCERK